jgi:hypothetical protein
MKISDQYDLTRNKIRYLDKDTIEVKLTQDKIMTTDSKFIKEVEQYPIITKIKKTNNSEKYYAICQDKKKTFPFSDLITNYKNIKFKNNDGLDLRLKNISEFGEIKVDQTILNDNESYDIINQYKYFEYLKNNEISKLPKNVWILGKPAGTIFNKNGNKNIYTICVTDSNQKQHTKTLNIKDFNNSDKLIKEEAEKIKIIMSYKLGMTKNLIRINDEYLEVKITDLKLMKVNMFLLKLIQKINIFISSGNSDVEYPATYLNDKNVLFHRLITQYNNNYLVDHINGDTLDNRYENLRPVNYSLNNINRHIDIKGYKEVNTIFGKAIKVYTKLDKKEYSKYYSVKKLGYEKACEMAKEFRNKVKLINNFDESFIEELNEKEDKIMLKYLTKIINKNKDIAIISVNYNKKIYLEAFESIDLDVKYKNNLFNNYILENIKLFNKLKDLDLQVQDKIKDIMYKHFMDHMDNRKKFYLFKKM